MKHIVKLFCELVKINSVSGNEGEMKKYLRDWASNNGFLSQVDEIGNLVIKHIRPEMISFFLCAHLDTVEPGKNIKPQIKNGYLVSDGDTILGADNKAAVAAIMVAAESVASTTDLGFELLFTIKEETGGGADFFDTAMLDTKLGFIFDYAHPLGGIVLAAPNIANFLISITGQASHSSTPWLGQNVLPAIVDILGKLKFGAQEKGETYLNVGKLHSGSAINSVPGLALIEGEVRSFDKKGFDQTLNEIEKLVHGAETTFPNLKFKVSFSNFCYGYSHEEKSKQIISLTKLFKKLHLNTAKEKVFGISDANSLNHLGLKVITLADGVVAPHTTGECIKVADLNKLSQIVVSMMKNHQAFV